MKYAILFVSLLALSACNDDRPRVNGIVDMTGNPYGTLNIFCFDNVKYIGAAGGGITAKIDSKTKQPELCTE